MAQGSIGSIPVGQQGSIGSIPVGQQGSISSIPVGQQWSIGSIPVGQQGSIIASLLASRVCRYHRFWPAGSIGSIVVVSRGP